MRILFATAELRPLVSAGGLGEAAAGLTAALRERGHDPHSPVAGAAGERSAPPTMRFVRSRARTARANPT